MESPESSETAMESEISIIPSISVQTEVSDISNSIEMNSMTSMNSSINELNVSDERMATGSPHRAKAFILNTDNNDWEEIATGICSPEPSEVIKRIEFICFYLTIDFRMDYYLL
jgi:hypothetical protein